MIPTPRNRTGSGGLVKVDPSELFPKNPEIKTSHDALEEDLMKHAKDANRRFANILIKPQKKIIGEVLLDSPVGEKLDAKLALEKLNEHFERITDYYAAVGTHFNVNEADYQTRYNMMHPENIKTKDEHGNPVIGDYDELNGGVNPDNLDSVMYNRMINGLPVEFDEEDNNDSNNQTTNDNYEQEVENVDASMFNF